MMPDVPDIPILALVFAMLMGASILAYVVLDGYDLGVGMLMPAADAEQQNLMVNSIGPFWDANETWLVLGVGILLVAFPASHGVILQALYLPVVAMLAGLMLPAWPSNSAEGRGWHRAVERAFLVRLLPPSFGAGRDARALHHRLRSGFLYWLFALPWWARRCAAARAARRDLARRAHRGRAAAEGARLGALGARLGGARRRAGEPRHAAGERVGAPQVVRFPGHALAHAAARRHFRGRYSTLVLCE